MSLGDDSKSEFNRTINCYSQLHVALHSHKLFSRYTIFTACCFWTVNPFDYS